MKKEKKLFEIILKNKVVMKKILLLIYPVNYQILKNVLKNSKK